LRKTASSNERSKLKVVLIAIALFIYPAFIHLSVAFHRPLLITGMWLAASAVGLVVAIRRGRAAWSLLFGVLLTSGIALWSWGDAIDLLYLPPVLINIALMVVFGRTLLSGATPLVARIASLWRGPLDPALSLYTRRVTIAWTVFFALMVAESIVLALFAPLHIWSLFTNFLNYIFVLLFFVVEYQLRLIRLPNHEHLSFRAFCHLVATTDLRTLGR
jgi:uncharacterized membrane protein